MKDVQRLNKLFKFKSYNLQEHSFFTSVLFIDLCKKISLEITSTDIEFVLKHDILEVITGDLPYTVKNISGETKAAWQLIEREVLQQNRFLSRFSDENIKIKFSSYSAFTIFRICDILCLWNFIYEEKKLGNKGEEIEEILNNCRHIIGNLIHLDLPEKYRSDMLYILRLTETFKEIYEDYQKK